MKSVRVRLQDRTYPIVIGKGSIERASEVLAEAGVRPRRALVVSQKSVLDAHGERLFRALHQGGYEPERFIAPEKPHSEAAKSQKTYLQLLKKLAALDGGRRPPFMVAFGGGVVGDLAGFAASVYRRGVPLLQIPTTLTAQVDSAIGGKNGIDLPQGKNLLGTVYQPVAVLADLETLDTLTERTWSDGFAEVIKYGVIRDAGLFALLEREGREALRRQPGKLEEVIARCVRIKAQVVEKDELDRKGVRAVLNFGHTTGHAIEAASRYTGRYTHGEAVGIGMLAACDIGTELGILKEASLTERLKALLVKFSLPIAFRGLSSSTLLKAMGYDKKAQSGSHRFILPVALGKALLVQDVPTPVILRALEKRRG